MSNTNDYSKWTSEPSYISHKILDNDLVAACKGKVTLKHLTNYHMLECVFLIVWCMKLKWKMYMKILVRINKCLILAIILLIQKIIMIQTN